MESLLLPSKTMAKVVATTSETTDPKYNNKPPFQEVQLIADWLNNCTTTSQLECRHHSTMKANKERPIIGM